MLARAVVRGVAVGLGMALAVAGACPARATPVSFDILHYGVGLENAQLGAPANAQFQTQKGVSWNVEQKVGGFVAGTGAEVKAYTSGQAGMLSGYRLDGMRTDMNFHGTSSVAFDDLGGGLWSARSTFQSTASSQFVTSGPEFELFGIFNIRGNAGVQGKGCFLGECASGSADYSFNASKDYVRAGNLGDAPFTYAGQNFDVKFDEPYRVVAGDCPGNIPECTIGFEIGRFTVFNPDLGLTGARTATGGLTAATTDRVGQLNIDLDFFLTTFVLLPRVGGAVELGPVSASFDLFDIDALLSFDLVQKQTFDPVATSKYFFAAPVRAQAIVRTATFNPSHSIMGFSCALAQAANPGLFPATRESVSFGQTAIPVGFIEGNVNRPCYDIAQTTQFRETSEIDVAMGDAIKFLADDPVDIFVSEGLAPRFTSQIDLNLIGGLQLDLLKGDFDFGDLGSGAFGPVLSTSIPGFTEPVELFRRTLPFATQRCTAQFTIDDDVSRNFTVCSQADSSETEQLFVAPTPDLPPIPDVVTIVGEVPEPPGLALMLAGVVGLGLTAARRSSRGGRRGEIPGAPRISLARPAPIRFRRM